MPLGEREFTLRTRSDQGNTPKLNYWGAESEYGVLKNVLLGPVENYKWLNTSSVSKKSLRRQQTYDLDIAKTQHNEMVSAYSSADVIVHTHEPDPELPYQIFARDSSIMTPYGAIITNMAQWWRKGENYRAIETYQKLGIPIYDFVTAGSFEGGDFNVIEPGCVLIGWEGEEGRSHLNAANQIKKWFQREGWEVFVTDIDPFYVHIDLMVVMIAEKLAAVCVDSTDPKVVKWLEDKGIRIISVPFQETIELGCNVVSLGNDRVLLPKASITLKSKLKAEGFTIFDPEMSMITQGGGGVHCMCQSLKRDPK